MVLSRAILVAVPECRVPMPSAYPREVAPIIKSIRFAIRTNVEITKASFTLLRQFHRPECHESLFGFSKVVAGVVNEDRSASWASLIDVLWFVSFDDPVHF